MISLRKSLLAIGLFGSTASFTPTQHLCDGFLPKNDLKIPVSIRQVGGITRAQFDQVLDRVEKYYVPVVKAKGANLSVNRLWEDDTVNASADQSGSTWNLNMYGGLARYPTINMDGYTLVACHEMGHHIGGAPKVSGWWNEWASNEGQSDYYATLNCMRFLFTEQENADFVAKNTIDPVLEQSCGTTYTTQADKNLCMRSGMAGMNVSSTFRDLGKQTAMPKFNTPDPSQVGQTDDEHPATQCRLDTYYQGALCVHDMATQPDDRDVNVGTCTAHNGQSIGLRPRCWYAP